MNPTVRDNYVKTLQDFQHVLDIQASTWTFRTIMDLRSVGKKSDVLHPADRTAILFRGILAILTWLPVNLVAIPHTFILGGIHRKWNKFTPMPQLHEIIPRLYLGTDQAARSESILQDHNITSILSILDFDIMVPERVEHYKRISIEDYPDVNLHDAIEEAWGFYNESMEMEGNVLIHCNMGKSRSASITIALVKRIQDWKPKDAISFVCSKRSVVGLNYGFKKQIQRLPKALE
jgi:hypothetical protein